MGVFNQNPVAQGAQEAANQENHPPDTPTHKSSAAAILTAPATLPRRFSPEKTPMQNRVPMRPRTTQSRRHSQSLMDILPSRETDPGAAASDILEMDPKTLIYDDVVPGVADEDENDDDIGDLAEDSDRAISEYVPQQDEYEPLNQQDDDEEADRTFEPEMSGRVRAKEPTQANSRRKRKLDTVDMNSEVEMRASPATKRVARRDTEDCSSETSDDVVSSPRQRSKQSRQKGSKSRPPLQVKDANEKLSSRQEKELNDIVEKVRARPGAQKSLYILRRETPADEGVTHTRSGRVSVKPLAYWRNERCVFGGSPGGATLADGARFPLNSIREIIRSEESGDLPNNRKSQSKNKKRLARKAPDAEAPSDLDTESEDEALADTEAESWEIEDGTFRGLVSIWDAEQQAPIEDEEEVDIAYASGAIQTKEVRGSTFRYAKLLSTKFFGTGIVDLPPGGMKRPKNSRKMHMSFFVATGRVTVQVGPIDGPESKFSIGKGGFWQVPRGEFSLLGRRHGIG